MDKGSFYWFESLDAEPLDGDTILSSYYSPCNTIIARAHADDNRELVLMPVGKLTNIALALKKDPSIAKKVRIVWLGSNYP